MPDYRRSQTIQAPPERLFDHLSQIENLPRYFQGMTSAEPGDSPGQIKVTADVDGKQVAGTAEFHVLQDANRIEWAAKGPNEYHGWLQVHGEGDRSEVEVHIATGRTAEAGDIEAGLERTLGEIRRLVEAGVADEAVGGN